MENQNFVCMSNEELMMVDGGGVVLLIGLGVLCVGAFGLGVYNGSKNNG
ncbi:MAG: class IIb bacteriocin, lactobin A/cerein 7B family [Lagierella massiliensis]|nr:class IIb bacteriocin, lactobin A/cerein 7B family [Lagierella massiliensis]